MQILYKNPTCDEDFIEIMEASILNAGIALELGAYENKHYQYVFQHLVGLDGGSIMKELLPMKLKDGAEISELSAECNNCDYVITEETMYGHIKEVFGAYRVEAMGHCPICHCWRMVNFRIKKDNEDYYMEFLNKDGGWTRIKEVEKDNESAIKKVLKKLFDNT
jgi:hypothetical protein